jgi:hypothetical protein
MKNIASVFGLVLALGACVQQPPYLAVSYDPAQALANMQARIESQGYRQVKLVEATPSPGANPAVYEGVAVTPSGKPFNFVILADGSMELLPFAARQQVPARPQYTCWQSGSSMQTCFGAR